MISLEKKLNELASHIDGKVAFAVKNFITGREFHLNSSQRFHAASIIKLPILGELFRQALDGVVSLDSEVVLRQPDIVDGAGVLLEMHPGISLTLRDLARLMIVVSDNTASNMLIDLLGFEAINNFIAAAGMDETCLNKKFMLPLKAPHLFNYTTAADTLMFLFKLYNNELLSEDFTAEAISILSRQQYREKIPKYLPREIVVANKTGEVSGVRHDAAIVMAPAAPYGIVVFTSDLKNEYDGDETVAQISLAVYDGFVSASAI